jgi:methionyl-tRNA synthetase
VEPAFEKVAALLEAAKLKAALEATMALAREGNRYLNLKEPWQRIKTDPQAAATAIFVALKLIDSLKILFAPFLPFTSQRLHEYFGYDGDLFGRLYMEILPESEHSHVALRYDGSSATGSWAPSDLKPGQELRPPAPLFVKLEPGVAEEEVERMAAATAG